MIIAVLFFYEFIALANGGHVAFRSYRLTPNYDGSAPETSYVNFITRRIHGRIRCHKNVEDFNKHQITYSGSKANGKCNAVSTKH